MIIGMFGPAKIKVGKGKKNILFFKINTFHALRNAGEDFIRNG